MNLPALASPEFLLGIIDTLDCGILLETQQPGLLHANAWIQRIAGAGRLASLDQVARLGGDDWRRFLSSLPDHCDREAPTFELLDVRKNHLVVQAAVRSVQFPAVNGESPQRLCSVTLTNMTPYIEAERRLNELNRHLAEISDTTIEQALGLQDSNAILEKKVEERTIELREANLAALQMLAIASEARDADTGEHVQRIQFYVELLAAEMGIAQPERKRLGYASILHDVGKIHVPDRILLKPGPLTPDERREMQNHTLIGERILSASRYFTAAAGIARSHHENWDGSGYPDGKKGLEVPLGARITHLADVFDALASPRVYKAAWPPEKVVSMIRDEQAKQFDPDVVDAFTRLLAKDAWTHPSAPRPSTT
jgi:hypothetical protein